MIGQVKGKVEQNGGREIRRRKWKRKRSQTRRKKKSRAKAHCLEKLHYILEFGDVYLHIYVIAVAQK